MKRYNNKFKINYQLFAENNITNLTNTTWTFNNSLDLTSTGITPVIDGTTDFVEISFTSANNSYNSFRIGSTNGISWNTFLYEDFTVYGFGAWFDSEYQNITITGGSDATNSNLISWLQSNATQIITGYSSTINLSNCTCDRINETELNGLYTATIIADDGYYLSSVTSTLGQAIISDNLKSAIVTIDNITNNFTINAIGTEIVETNIILHPNNNGITDYTKNLLPKTTIINSKSTIIEATKNSPDLIQVDGKLYYKKISEIIQNAGSITDLTGTTWVFNQLTLTDAQDFSYSINFISNDENFIGFSRSIGDFDSIPTEYYYETSEGSYCIYNDFQGGWLDVDTYKSIEIIDGQDVTNTDLISYLQINATLQPKSITTYEYKELGLKDSIITLENTGIKYRTYDNTTFAEHLDEILGYVNTENGGPLICLGFKTADANAIGDVLEITTNLSDNSVSVDTLSGQAVMGALTYHCAYPQQFVSATTDAQDTHKGVYFNCKNAFINGIGTLYIDHRVDDTPVVSISGSVEYVLPQSNPTSYIRQIFRDVSILDLPLEHLVITYHV